jgi:hypothetical protein
VKLIFSPPALPARATIAVLDPTADAQRWFEQNVARVRRVQISRRKLTTMHGWPLELVTFEVAGKLALLAVYSFFDLTAAALIAGVDHGWLEQHEAALFAAHRDASPDWRADEALSIAELRDPTPP